MRRARSLRREAGSTRPITIDKPDQATDERPLTTHGGHSSNGISLGDEPKCPLPDCQHNGDRSWIIWAGQMVCRSKVAAAARGPIYRRRFNPVAVRGKLVHPFPACQSHDLQPDTVWLGTGGPAGLRGYDVLGSSSAAGGMTAFHPYRTSPLRRLTPASSAIRALWQRARQAMT